MATKAKLIEFLAAGLEDSNGNPLSGYQVRTFASDGSTAKAVWEDRDKTLPTTAGKSSFTLDSTGRASVYGDGIYTVKVWTASADPDVDNPYKTYSGVEARTGAADLAAVANVTALRGLSGSADGEIVYLVAHTTNGDGGHGQLRWDASSTSADDGGVVFRPTAIGVSDPGRWVRDVDMLDIRAYGTVNGTALYNACATGKLVYIPPGGSYSVTLTSDQITTVLGALKKIRAFDTFTITLPESATTLTTIFAGCPGGKNLVISGTTMPSTSITAASAVSNGSGDHDLTLTVSDASGVDIGDFVIVKAIVGTATEKVIEGCWEVTGVSGSDITVLCKARKTALPALTVSSGTMYKAKTVLKVDGDIGIDIDGDAGTWKNIVLAGNGAGTGDIAGVRIRNGSGTFAAATNTPFAVVNFKEHGFYAIQNSFLECFDAYSSGNGQAGAYALDGGNITATRLIATGNGTTGLIASNGSSVAGSSGNYSGNTQRGIWASQDSSIIAASAGVYENAEVGVRADLKGVASVSSAKIAGNSSYGIRAVDGHAVATSADYTGGNGADDERAEDNGSVDNYIHDGQFGKGGVAGTAGSTADDLIIRANASESAGLTILTDNAGTCAIHFGDSDDTDVGRIRYNHADNRMYFHVNANNPMALEQATTTGIFYPLTNDAHELGKAAVAWKNIYSVNAVTVTSDEHYKQDIGAIPDAVLDAWAEVEFCRYRMREAVAEKGAAARWHIGVIAQRIEEAFARHGLNAFEYGLLCFDQWEEAWDSWGDEYDKEGNLIRPAGRELIHGAGSKYSIRADECQFLEMALMRRELRKYAP